MKKLDTKRISEIVAEKFSTLFEDIKIVDVHVTPGHDRDGEEILRIEVVFKGTLKKADAKQLAGATRQLRPALEEIDADLYPLLSFVSKLDYDREHKREAR